MNIYMHTFLEVGIVRIWCVRKRKMCRTRWFGWFFFRIYCKMQRTFFSL